MGHLIYKLGGIDKHVVKRCEKEAAEVHRKCSKYARWVCRPAFVCDGPNEEQHLAVLMSHCTVFRQQEAQQLTCRLEA